jgi:hypothetical protein
MRKAHYWLLTIFLAMSLGVVSTPNAYAGGTVSGATIQQLAINKGIGPFVFIKVDVPPAGAPSCASGYWQYTLTLTNQGDSALYALLLTAYTLGRQVYIVGTGACSEFSQSESLSDLQLM